VDKVFEGKSVPISRRVILYHYFDSFLKNLQINQALTESQISHALEKGLVDYVKAYEDHIYKNPLEQLRKAE
jgi:hypothetical protein